MLIQAGVPADAAVARVLAGTTRAEGLRNIDIDRVWGRCESCDNEGWWRTERGDRTPGRSDRDR